jgi:hypothetical protein
MKNIMNSNQLIKNDYLEVKLFTHEYKWIDVKKLI